MARKVVVSQRSLDFWCLFTPLFLTQTKEAIRYLEFCIDRLGNRDQAIHNYLLSLYIEQEDDESLLRYLLQQGQVQKISMGLFCSFCTCSELAAVFVVRMDEKIFFYMHPTPRHSFKMLTEHYYLTSLHCAVSQRCRICQNLGISCFIIQMCFVECK